MKLINISQGYIVKVDDNDYDELMKYKWSYHGGYAVRGQRFNGKMKLIRMHHWLMSTPVGMVTDHIDGDRLNNQRSNLRIATKAQNLMNRGANKNNTSGYKGVYLLAKPGRVNIWGAAIKIDRKRIFLGAHPNKEEAAQAYNEAALKYHGSFANINVLK